ncbi:MAG: ATP-binding protein, partial [Steroidobacteraceae bacterium]
MESIPDGGRSSVGRATSRRGEPPSLDGDADPRTQIALPRGGQARASEAAGFGAFEWHPRSGAFCGSQALAALLGCEQTRAPGSFGELIACIHAEDRGALEREMRAAVAARRAALVHARIVRSGAADGPGIRWLRWRASVFCDAQGEVDRLIGLVEDVTREKQTEAEHRALMRRERALRAAAEQANRSKDEFLSMFSHELRSPLNAILGWNRILAVKRAGDEEVAAMTARIERSAKTQLKMVNDLLDLGRISTGKLKIDPRPTRLASAVAAALDASRPAAAAKSIELTSAIDPEGSEVYGDPVRLQQVVWNLLSNALKFTDAGGRVDVTLRRAGGVMALSVADSGQGIEPELLPHVFDRFRQGDSSTTRHTSGLGLGLALVREIVALHGGTASAASDGHGRGSTFRVNLPALRAEGPSSEVGLVAQPRTPERALAGLAILVVDDEA